MPDGEINRSFRRNDGRLMVTNPGVIGEVLAAVESLGVCPDGLFVLTVGTDRKRRFREDPFQGRLLVDEHIAGTRTNEDLDARRARCLLEFVDVLRRGPDVEAVVDDGFRCCQRQFVVQSLDRSGRRFGIGHLEERRHAPFCAGKRPGVEIFLVCQSRIAEVDLIVDYAWNQHETGGIDGFVDMRSLWRIDGKGWSCLQSGCRRDECRPERRSRHR